MKLPFLLFIALVLAACPIAGAELASESVAQKLANEIKVPRVDFKEATLQEALEFLAKHAKALDPKGKGMNIFFKAAAIQNNPPGPGAPAANGIPAPPPPPGAVPPPPPAPGQPGNEKRVTLSLRNVSLSQALLNVVQLSNCKLRWDENGVMIAANGDKIARLPLKVAAGTDPKLVADIKATVLPKVNFGKSTVRDACEFLHQRFKQLAPNEEGLNLALNLKAEEASRVVTFTANDLPVLEAFRYVAELADLEVKLEKFAVVISAPEKK
jgi:hypothetical protein